MFKTAHVIKSELPVLANEVRWFLIWNGSGHLLKPLCFWTRPTPTSLPNALIHQTIWVSPGIHRNQCRSRRHWNLDTKSHESAPRHWFLRPHPPGQEPTSSRTSNRCSASAPSSLHQFQLVLPPSITWPRIKEGPSSSIHFSHYQMVWPVNHGCWDVTLQ